MPAKTSKPVLFAVTPATAMLRKLSSLQEESSRSTRRQMRFNLGGYQHAAHAAARQPDVAWPVEPISQVSLLACETGARARRSAMRVCQPGPVARHREITSTGKRKEMSCRGLADLGRPPFLITARLSMASVSSGNSLYSADFTTCVSTRARSEPKVRGEACLFTIICLSHTKNVAHRATQGVANHHHASGK